MIVCTVYEDEVQDLLRYAAKRLGSAETPDFLYVSRDPDGQVHVFLNHRRAHVGLARRREPGAFRPWWEAL